jgi:hypothetical protein
MIGGDVTVTSEPRKGSVFTVRPRPHSIIPRPLIALGHRSLLQRDRTARVLVTTAKAAAPRVSETWQHPTRAPVRDPEAEVKKTPAKSRTAFIELKTRARVSRG